MFKINKIVNNVKDSLQREWDKGKGGSKFDIVKSITVVSFLGLGLLLNILVKLAVFLKWEAAITKQIDAKYQNQWAHGKMSDYMRYK